MNRLRFWPRRWLNPRENVDVAPELIDALAQVRMEMDASSAGIEEALASQAPELRSALRSHLEISRQLRQAGLQTPSSAADSAGAFLARVADERDARIEAAQDVPLHPRTLGWVAAILAAFVLVLATAAGSIAALDDLREFVESQMQQVLEPIAEAVPSTSPAGARSSSPRLPAVVDEYMSREAEEVAEVSVAQATEPETPSQNDAHEATRVASAEASSSDSPAGRAEGAARASLSLKDASHAVSSTPMLESAAGDEAPMTSEAGPGHQEQAQAITAGHPDQGNGQGAGAANGQGPDGNGPPGQAKKPEAASNGQGPDGKGPPGQSKKPEAAANGQGSDGNGPPGQSKKTEAPSNGQGSDGNGPPGQSKKPEAASNGQGADGNDPPRQSNKTEVAADLKDRTARDRSEGGPLGVESKAVDGRALGRGRR